MAPPGSRVLVHVKPQDRATWSPLGKNGWYTGPAFESYRCYAVWIWASRSTRICGTLTWLPTKLAMPDLTPTPSLSAPPTLEPFPDPSLRVAVPAAPDNTSLRVPTPTAPNLARRTIQFAPLPSDILVATVSNSTGLHGKRAAPQDSSPSATCHPHLLPNLLHAARRHSHDTRLASRLRHISAAARNDVAARAAAHTGEPSQYYALHGNAFNPHTGKLAEFRELSQCSKGPHWQNSNADKIGRLAQGHGNQKGTNTTFFINVVVNMPKGRKATYLRVVAATRPEKVIALTILTMSVPKQDLTTANSSSPISPFQQLPQYMTANLKDFYLGTPLTCYE
ncbi:hypothetical protein MHU86_1117 [Fragilaria crotonensis]|nr:hypothetical protein MHU86_1117 [Fragilaria crotonensis]